MGKLKNVLKTISLTVFLLIMTTAMFKVGAYAETHTDHEGWTVLTADEFLNNTIPLQGGKYYLSDNIIVDQPLWIADGQLVTICLNGKTITSSKDTLQQMFVIGINSTLVIDDCVGTGVVTAPGTVVCEDTKAEVTPSHFVMNGGKLVSEGAGNTIHITGNISDASRGVTTSDVTINGGTIENPDGAAIYAIDCDNITINNAHIISSADDNYTIVIDGSILTVNGGTIEYNGEYEFSSCISGEGVQAVKINGGTIKSNGAGLWVGGSSLNISGGEFITTGKSLECYMWDSLNISGGSFKSSENDCAYLNLDSEATASITGGSFESSGGDGIVLGDCGDVIMNGIKVKSTVGDGIRCYLAHKILLSNAEVITEVNCYNKMPKAPVNMLADIINIDGSTKLTGVSGYPHIIIQYGSFMFEIPSKLPEKPFKVQLMEDRELTEFFDWDPEVDVVSQFSQKFPGKKISNYINLVSSQYSLVEVNNGYFSGTRSVVKEPTLENPTMEVTEEGNVSYQWYDVTPGSMVLTEENVEPYASFNDGQWNINDYTGAFVFEQQHDYAEIVIDVKQMREPVSSSLRGIAGRDTNNILIQNINNFEDKYVVMPVTKPGVYKVQLNSKGTFKLTNYSLKDLKATVTMNYWDLNSKEAGQTSKTLTSFTKGYKSCLATFDMGNAYLPYHGKTGSLRGDVPPEYKDTNIKSTLLSNPVYINFVPVTFESNGGSKIASVNVTPGNLLKKPADPKFSGLVFKGWYKDEALKTAWNFSKDKVEGSVTLYAKWDVSKEQFQKNSASLLEKYRVEHGKTSSKITWGKVKTADEYGVFIGYCGPKFSKNPTTVVKANAKKLTKSFKKINGKKLTTKSVKGMVAAYKYAGKQKIKIGETPVGHSVAASDKKVTNVKSLKLDKTKLTVKKNKSVTIKATATKQYKNKAYPTKDHGPLFRYVSSDESIVKVNSKGKITGKKKGTAYVYVLVNDGMNKKVKVTVK